MMDPRIVVNYNRDRSWMGTDMLEYKNLRVTAICPLPANQTVMVVSVDSEDRVVMRDVEETPFAYCLALAENQTGDTVVYPYDIQNGLDPRASVVNIRRCPLCGKRMHMTMAETDVASLQYDCKDCGYTVPAIPAEDEEEGEYEHE